MTGLFEHIPSPLWQDRYHSDDMTLEFLSKHGNKPISNIVKTVNPTGGELTEQQVTKLINLIYRKHQEQWARTYEALDSVYKILDNYNMVETEQVDRDQLESRLQDILNTTSLTNHQKDELIENFKRTDNLTHRKTGKDTETGRNTSKNTATDKQNNTSTRTDNTTATETYVNRKDLETRNLIKFGDGKDLGRENKSQDQYFVGREDVRQSNRNDNTTNKGNTTGRDETSTGIDGTKTSYYNGNGGDGSPPGGSGTGTNGGFVATNMETDNSDEVRVTSTRGDATNTVDQRTTDYETLAKNGSEVTDETNYTTMDKNYSDTDKGTVSNEKLGSEVQTNTGTVKTADTIDGTKVDDRTDTIDQDTIYNTTDIDTGTVENNNTRTNTQDGTESGNNTTTDDTQTTSNMTEERTLTRSGNIGVTTSVQMMREHINFWVSFSFLDIVYQDTAKMLTLPIYEGGSDNGYVRW